MKKLLFLILAALFFGPIVVSAQQLTWQKIYQFDGWLARVYFTDVDNGFVSVGSVPGEARTQTALYRTHDGGVTWTEVSVEGLNHSGFGIQDILMVDNLTGWACGHSDAGICLWKTTDGGDNWIAISGAGTDLATNVRITSAGLLISGFNTQKIRRSTDGGKSFVTLFKPPLQDNLLGMDFTDNDHGVVNACYRAGNPWYFTSDGGLTWSKTNTNTCMESWSIYAEKGTSRFYCSPEGFSNQASYNTDIYRSDDYGQNWKIVHHFNLQMNGHMDGVGEALYIQTECLGCTQAGAYRSTDQGVTWTWLGGRTGRGDTRFDVVGGSCFNVLYQGGENFGLYKAFDSIGSSKGSATTGVLPVSQVTSVTNPGDTAGVEVLAVFPSGSPAIGSKPDEVTYTITFDSKVIVCQGIANVIPPAGWTVKTVSFTTNGLEVMLANPTKSAIVSPQDFGRVIFTVLTGASVPSSTVSLDKVVLTGGCSIITGYSSLESGFLKRIVAGTTTVESRPTSEAPVVSLRPNPALGSVTLSFEAMKDRRSTISVMDVTGKVLVTQEVPVQPTGEYVLSLSVLPSGSYMIMIDAGVIASGRIEVVK